MKWQLTVVVCHALQRYSKFSALDEVWLLTRAKNELIRPILKRAGLPQIRLYDLRHTAATLVLSAGVPIKVVSEQLGHAGSALTMDVYSHVSPDMQEEAVRKVEEKLMRFVKMKGGTSSGDSKST